MKEIYCLPQTELCIVFNRSCVHQLCSCARMRRLLLGPIHVHVDLQTYDVITYAQDVTLFFVILTELFSSLQEGVREAIASTRGVRSEKRLGTTGSKHATTVTNSKSGFAESSGSRARHSVQPADVSDDTSHPTSPWRSLRHQRKQQGKKLRPLFTTSECLALRRRS